MTIVVCRLQKMFCLLTKRSYRNTLTRRKKELADKSKSRRVEFLKTVDGQGIVNSCSGEIQILVIASI